MDLRTCLVWIFVQVLVVVSGIRWLLDGGRRYGRELMIRV